jgi:hypothetical protein
VLVIWDFGSILKSRQAKLSQAKPSQQHGKPAKASQSMWIQEEKQIKRLNNNNRRMLDQSTFGKDQDGLIRSSIFNAIAAQVHLNKK